MTAVMFTAFIISPIVSFALEGKGRINGDKNRWCFLNRDGQVCFSLKGAWGQVSPHSCFLGRGMRVPTERHRDRMFNNAKWAFMRGRKEEPHFQVRVGRKAWRAHSALNKANGGY